VGIDVERGADLLGDVLKRDIFAKKFVITVFKVIHMNDAPQSNGQVSRTTKVI
jgi:hypothetical protein